MSDRTQDLKNLRAVATACKNYVDETKEQILWQVGQYNITTQDDNTTAYQKVVPTGATRVKIKSIGGMSYKSENLILEQKQVNLNPGSEQWIQFNVNVENGQTYTLANYEPTKSNEVWQCTTIGYTNFTTTPRTFTATTSVITIRCGANTLNGNINYQSKIMLVKGSTALPYEPYFEGIRDSAVTAVKSYGANLFDIQNATYSSSDNWNITTDFWLEAGKTYTIKSNATAHNLFTTGVAGWGNITNVSRTFTPSQSGYLMFGASDYNWYPHLTEFKQLEIMLNYGSTALTYKAYRGLIGTITIPDEVKALEGYGRGISESIYNYIDLITPKTISGVDTTKSYVKNVGKQQNINIVSLSGLSNEVNSFFSFEKPTGMNATDSVYSRNYLCNKYNVVQHQQDLTNASLQNKIISNISSSNNYLCLPAGATIEQAQTAINDVYLYYKLETPVETDISEYIDNNVIEVEEGGYLVFENQYGQAVPSNITYRIEVAK